MSKTTTPEVVHEWRTYPAGGHYKIVRWQSGLLLLEIVVPEILAPDVVLTHEVARQVARATEAEAKVDEIKDLAEDIGNERNAIAARVAALEAENERLGARARAADAYLDLIESQREFRVPRPLDKRAAWLRTRQETGSVDQGFWRAVEAKQAAELRADAAEAENRRLREALADQRVYMSSLQARTEDLADSYLVKLCRQAIERIDAALRGKED
jgi:chromosome segregation ATPase